LKWPKGKTEKVYPGEPETRQNETKNPKSQSRACRGVIGRLQEEGELKKGAKIPVSRGQYEGQEAIKREKILVY